jgi:hypothetical protein
LVLKKLMKNKIGTIGIIIATVILAGVAIFTAVRLYQLRQESITPVAPTSKPKAQEVELPKTCDSLAFNLGTATASATPTATPTITPTATPTDNPNICNGTCGSNDNCESGLICSNGFCRNPSCVTESDCVCEGTPNSCGGTCGSNYNCQSDLFCNTSVGLCRNPDCGSEADCTCPVSTRTPAPTGTAAPSLPDAGTSLPSILGIGIGSILLIGALLLAL